MGMMRFLFLKEKVIKTILTNNFFVSLTADKIPICNTPGANPLISVD